MARSVKYENNQVVYSKLYKVWNSMISRCNNRDDYKHLTVCDEWRTSFERFRFWAQTHGYVEGLQIDRVNNEEGYYPDNCRFATAKQNCLNRSTTRDFGGKSAEDVAKELGLTRQAISYRIRVVGMSLEEASTTPKTPNGYARKQGIGKWKDA